MKIELSNAYYKIKFLEPEMIEVDVKVEHISTKNLDKVLTSQKSFSNKTGLRYIGENNSDAIPRKEVKFVLANVVEKPNTVGLVVENKAFVAQPKARAKSLPKKEIGPQVKHFYHHCDARAHTRPNCFKLHTHTQPNCFKLRALKRTDQQLLLMVEQGNQKQSKMKKMDKEL